MSAEQTTDTEHKAGYDFATIEAKWQSYWDEHKLFEVGDEDPRPSYYALSMFPYPSGKLHTGHARNYALIDAIGRFQTAKGHAVINPIGWDAFGLPAENAAIKSGIHPKISTFQHIDHMRKQLKALGIGFDWSRELFTCREDYYKWTQWLFLQMLNMKGKSGEPLVYRKKSKVNWCPHDLTVLANEQVVTVTREGEEYQGCFRCDTKVEQRELEQWCFRITDYADELLDCLDDLEGHWPENVLKQQREWIGRSEGTNIAFTAEVNGDRADIAVFTTRADTLFGVTFIALAPEHPLMAEIIAACDDAKAKELQAFVDEILAMDTQERAAITEKEGIDTGVRATHPLTGEDVPVYVGNYVLMYGTGAVMAVPAHDQRDFEFARAYDLPTKPVIKLADNADDDMREAFAAFEAGEAAFTAKGVMHNSADYDGMSSDVGIERMQEKLAEANLGGKTTNYRLRDWGLSRQRYWGCPIPVIHCEDCGIVPVPEEDLPVTLPEDVEFVPTGRSPLETHPDFTQVTCPKCGRRDARRDTDTMDTFVDSSWYFVRFCDPNNSEQLADPEKVRRWMPVDQYIGGAEHAILHLIYARFIHKVLRDVGITNSDEPFNRLYTQGMILKEAIQVKTENYRYVTEDEAKEKGYSEDQLQRDVRKMGKSFFNTVDPMELMEDYGVDTVRAYTLFIGPPDAECTWDDAGVSGIYRFLKRWWDELNRWLPLIGGKNCADDAAGCSEAGKELRRLSHLYIQKTERDYGGDFGFNTCISKAMELVNFLRDQKPPLADSAANRFAITEALETLALCMAPITPHICEEMWQQLGHDRTIVETPWPTFREELTAQDTIQLGVQVNGKVRDQLKIAADASKDEYEKAALELEGVKRNLEGKTVRKVIVVPGRIVNIVAS